MTSFKVAGVPVTTTKTKTTKGGNATSKTPRTTSRRLKAEKARDELQVQVRNLQARVDKLEAHAFHSEDTEAELSMSQQRVVDLTNTLNDLRQAHWDGRAVGGFDNDGDPTPSARSGDFAKMIVEDWRSMREDLDEARRVLDTKDKEIAKLLAEAFDRRVPQQMAHALSGFVNGVNNAGLQEMAQYMINDHRTLIQSKMRLFIMFCELLHQSYVEQRYDLRNEASCKLASAIMNIKPDNLLLLPYI